MGFFLCNEELSLILLITNFSLYFLSLHIHTWIHTYVNSHGIRAEIDQFSAKILIIFEFFLLLNLSNKLRFLFFAKMVELEVTDENGGVSSSSNLNSGNVSIAYNDPFYITSSDQTASKLVSINLNGSNFISWKRNVRRALIAKNKIGFIEGTIVKPDESHKDYNRWMRCDYLVICWLMNSMNEEIGENFTFVESSAQLWNEIGECYGQSNGPQIYQLKRELDNLKQENQSIMIYYGKLKRFWDELQNLRSLPTCTCGVLLKCSCSFLKRLSEFESEEKLMQFLLGLNSGFDNAISNILAMDPLPSISRAFYLAQQMEKQKEVSSMNSSPGNHEVSAFAVQQKQQSYARNSFKKDWRKDKSERMCDFCKKQGHTKDVCFKLKGFPEWFTKKYGVPSKIAAHVSAPEHISYAGDDPLDFNAAGPVSSYQNNNAEVPDATMMQSIMNEVMKAMKGKQIVGESSNNSVSYANYAGINFNTSASDIWIVDSGATDHMVFDDKLFMHKRTLVKQVEIGLPDGTCSYVSEIGSVAVFPNLILKDVLYVPSFKHNLISVGKLIDDAGIEVVFRPHECVFTLSQNNYILGTAPKIGGLYLLNSSSKSASTVSHKIFPIVTNVVVADSHSSTLSSKSPNSKSYQSSVNSFDLLHARLGHISLSKMKHLGICDCNHLNNYFCETCVYAKHHKLPFPRSLTRAAKCFDLIHIDLWGPYKHKSISGASYFLTILDDHSRCTWTYLLHNKLQVYRTISTFILQIENQFHTTIKVIRSDNGTEIIQDQCLSLFMNKGILNQNSIVGRPQQNGRVERKHRHLLEVARALKLHAKLPSKFWGDCLLTATYLINIMPSSVINWNTPSEILFGKPPDYSMLKIFGCLCFAYNDDRTKDKFSPRAKKCIFLGYPFGQKGFKVYDLESHKCFVSRDVIFQEHSFPFHQSSLTKSSPLSNNNSTVTFDDPISSFDNTPLPNNLSTPSIPIPTSSPSSDSYQLPTANNHSSPIMSHIHSPVSINSPITVPFSSPTSSMSLTPTSHHTTTLSSNNDILPIPRHSSRISKPPAKFQDFICPTLPAHSTSLSFSVHTHLDSIPEPTSYQQATQFPEWKHAMQQELIALETNETWVLTTLPQGKKAIGSKWVFKIKHKADGSVERFKARLVATGYQQVEGEDFTHTFSPVAKLATVRVIISLATAKHWPLCQLDINNAFLHGYLEEEVYMRPPLGYDKAKTGEVCLLKRSLYGLKQASRQWNKELSKFLISLGFTQSKQDYSLFTRDLHGEFVIILVYVDDMVLTGTSQSQIDIVKQELHQAFTIKDLGDLKYFLGIEVIRNNSGTLLSQRKYILDIIKDLNLDKSKPVSSPLPKGLGLSTEIGDILEEPEQYRKLVGRLLYLNITRPDLSYATQHLSQFLSCPRKPHLQAAMYVVRYLKATLNLGLFYSAQCDLILKAYSDADWSTCTFSSRSLSAYCIFLGSHLVSWKTKKQKTVSKSSAEAEYRSMSSTASEIVWLEGLLQDLKIHVPLPIYLYCDNTAAQHIAQNPVFHERTKHLKRDCHYVREQVEAGFLKTSHISSHLQLADLLTKPLPGPQHQLLASKLGLVDSSHVQLEGGI